MKWFLKVWRNYINFDGRARRTEYWMFALFNFLIISALLLLGGFLAESDVDPMAAFIPYYLYFFAALVPSLAVTVRRLHDVGKSGWFLLISLIPLVGAIWLLVLYVTEGDPGPNAYGEDPKGGEVAEWV